MYPILTLKSYEYLNFMKICEVKIYSYPNISLESFTMFLHHFLFQYKILNSHEDLAREFGIILPCKEIAVLKFIALEIFLEKNEDKIRYPISDEIEKFMNKDAS